MKKSLFYFTFCIVFIVTSCSVDSSDGGRSSGSIHNTGNYCLGCHSFKVVGSVYNSALSAAYAGAVIKITTSANGGGTLLATLTSDMSGNFYTNGSVSFGSGVYVSITGSGGAVKYMGTAITSGA